MSLLLLKSLSWIPFLLIYYTGSANAQITNITIQLNKTLTFGNKELYGGFFNINASHNLNISYENVNPNVSFIVFQTHSFQYNLTLSYTFEGDGISGTNIGLYRLLSKDTQSFFVENRNNVNLKFYVSIHGYQKTDPIPGGCNMEFKVSIAPYIEIYNDKDYILCDAGPSKDFNDTICGGHFLETVFYRMYLPEHNFNSDVYFDGIKKMLTLENIQQYGHVVTETHWPMRRLLAAYPGTGTVFAIVTRTSKYPNQYSVYVPAVTYACTPLEDDCILLTDTLSQLFCAVLFFAGTFVCFFGHRFFKTEMFLFGTITGVIITYILICFVATLERPALLGASFVSGIFFGVIWALFWWFYGIPVLSVLLPTLNFGFLCAAILYFHLPNIAILDENFNFWAVFILVMLVTSVIMVAVTFVSNILCCAVLGAYAIVYSLDFYIGSNIKYILINVLRRAVVPLFRWAQIDPPYNWNDGFVITLWVVFAVSGFAYQHLHSKNRPPFPPPPRCIRPESAPTYGAVGAYGSQRPMVTPAMRPRNANEHTPLLF